MMISREHSDTLPNRYSAALVISLTFHALLLPALIFWVRSQPNSSSSVHPSTPTHDARPHHSPAPARPGLGGGSGQAEQPLPRSEAEQSLDGADGLQLRIGMGAILEHLWQSTLFAIGAGLLTLAFRKNRARIRYGIWFCVSVKVLVPLSLLIWAVSTIAQTASPSRGGVHSAADGLATHAEVDSPVARAFTSTQSPVARIGIQLLFPVETQTRILRLLAVNDDWRGWLDVLVLAIWTAGFGAVCARRIQRSRRHWDLVSISRRVELLGIKTPSRLQIGLAEGQLEPTVVGWVHPVLLFPADIERHLTYPGIEALVLHELCHVRRLDTFTAAVHMAAEAVFWFHPLIWWLGDRLVDERERACDEYVLSRLDSSQAYLTGLLATCDHYLSSQQASIAGVCSRNIKPRLEAIRAHHIGETIGAYKRLMLGAVGISLLIVPLWLGMT
jgi:beta-lactamase regulating signal transducer with metallopeptidase domain